MPAGSLHLPFHTPFFEGAAVSGLVPSNFHVAIAGHPYMIDVTKYSRRALSGVSEQIDQSPEPGEASLSREGFWPRSQSRFDHGAGQEFYDEEGADRQRWWTSRGIDPWTDRGYGLRLLHDVEEKATITGSARRILSVGGRLYVADGANLRHTQNPDAASPTWTTIAAGGTIDDICTDGAYVYIARAGVNIDRTAVGASGLDGSWPTGGSIAQPGVVAFANGRLLGANGNELFEIEGDGDKASIRVDPRTSLDWVSIVGSPSSAYAAINGAGGEIYALTVDDVTTSIAAPRMVGELPAGELVNTLHQYAGVLLIGTTAGFRVAVIQDGGALSIGELVEVAQADGGVRCFTSEGQFTWFGWTDFDGDSTGLGRADLASNTSENTLVPAYASDLLAPVGGDVVGVARHEDRTYFLVDGEGLYGDVDELVPSGTVNTGWIRFSTLVPKMFSGVQVGHDPLVGSIQTATVDQEGQVRHLGVSGSGGTVFSTIFDASGEGVATQLQFTLTRDADVDTLGPVMRYWTLNALPVPNRVEEIIVPVMLWVKVTDLIGRDRRQDPLAEFQYLKSLQSSAALVTYQEGDLALTVRVDNVAILENDTLRWMEVSGRGGNPDRIWFQNPVATVRLLTKEA